jgi:hypothetical protein
MDTHQPARLRSERRRKASRGVRHLPKGERRDDPSDNFTLAVTTAFTAGSNAASRASSSIVLLSPSSALSGGAIVADPARSRPTSDRLPPEELVGVIG